VTQIGTFKEHCIACYLAMCFLHTLIYSIFA
jgi:hypothetical protein